MPDKGTYLKGKTKTDIYILEQDDKRREERMMERICPKCNLPKPS